VNWSNKTILLTGGTGSFGKAFTKFVLKKLKPKAIRIFSRDELKQFEMRSEFNNNPTLRFLLGDVRDKARLYRAIDGADIVVHAAALKQVPAAEYNPSEFILTNIIGTQNVADVSIDLNVDKVMMISTDKAVNPVNLYGATKLCAEKLVVQSNSYRGANKKTKLSVSRYGNVVGSRGSVIPLILQQKKTGEISLTDERMTRFWITLEQAIDFVTRSMEDMQGGEIFVPKIPSMKIIDLVNALGPECKVKIIGTRPGEKIHEVLLNEEEVRSALDVGDRYVVLPKHISWEGLDWKKGKNLSEDFIYSSDKNDWWLTIKELLKIVKGQENDEEEKAGN